MHQSDMCYFDEPITFPTVIDARLESRASTGAGFPPSRTGDIWEFCFVVNHKISLRFHFVSNGALQCLWILLFETRSLLPYRAQSDTPG